MSFGVFDFQKPCASKRAGPRVKDTSRCLCYSVLCGHCLPSCQAEHQAPGVLVIPRFIKPNVTGFATVMAGMLVLMYKLIVKITFC